MKHNSNLDEYEFRKCLLEYANLDANISVDDLPILPAQENVTYIIDNLIKYINELISYQNLSLDEYMLIVEYQIEKDNDAIISSMQARQDHQRYATNLKSIIQQWQPLSDKKYIHDIKNMILTDIDASYPDNPAILDFPTDYELHKYSAETDLLNVIDHYHLQLDKLYSAAENETARITNILKEIEHYETKFTKPK